MSKFNLTNLKQAWEKGDAATLAGFVADSFEQTEIDESTPPNAPRKRTRLEYLDMAERGLSSGAKMKVYNLVPGDERAAYSFTCHMPSGVKMVGNSIIEIKNGKIIKEVTVQAKEK
ncbi:hypothetical protein A3J32_03530 [Candidatus Saccharibacteria bacterium RIFCSPLOWO2_02_FULL_46_7]|nr:MAG: hypothetical protein A3J32_03530 [Candidatus Saccharibacteria bacterium RIFCSPLOWO2_02_FULL_46_7]